MKSTVVRKKLFQSVKELIDKAQQNTVRSVNTTMLITYFEIGRMIIEIEQQGNIRAGYAKQTLQNLSTDLSKVFGKGYSISNLEYMSNFYKTYQERIQPISQSVIGKLKKSTSHKKSQSLIGISEKPSKSSDKATFPFQLSWTHYIQLLKIKNDDERNFYEIEAVSNNWSVRELQRQYNSSVYERIVLSRDKKKVKQLSKKGQLIEQTSDALKSHYVLEFLGLREESSYSESDLETAIINKLESFMLELGKGFLYEGRQRRFTFDGDTFYVDLVFYNRHLKCFVLFDLKLGKLTHQDIGQMQMYVNYYDRKVKLPKENKTIGIILCKEKTGQLLSLPCLKIINKFLLKCIKLCYPQKLHLQNSSFKFIL